MSTASSVTTTAENRYVPRGRNELHTIFERHFDDFCEQYDEKYAATYGMYRMPWLCGGWQGKPAGYPISTYFASISQN